MRPARSTAFTLAAILTFGKQHGKYIVSDNIGFVRTTNFDYRSRLYNCDNYRPAKKVKRDIQKNRHEKTLDTKVRQGFSGS